MFNLALAKFHIFAKPEFAVIRPIGQWNNCIGSRDRNHGCYCGLVLTCSHITEMPVLFRYLVGSGAIVEDTWFFLKLLARSFLTLYNELHFGGRDFQANKFR